MRILINKPNCFYLLIREKNVKVLFTSNKYTTNISLTPNWRDPKIEDFQGKITSEKH